MTYGRDILIADAGGTNTRWCVLGRDGYLKRDLQSLPINACVTSDGEINRSLHSVETLISSCSEIYFYGAGCASDMECNRIRNAFSAIGYEGEVFVYSDMVGAARALFGNEKGVACILGTGSNSCFYDGQEIVYNVPPLGYILGDEGGGAAIGKRFLKALLRNDLPEYISENFFKESTVDVAGLYDRVYRRPYANQSLASITKFIHKYIDEPSVRHIVEEEFDEFFRCVVNRYRVDSSVSIAFIGSVAYYFDNILRTTASRYDRNIAAILRNPVEGLIRYHRNLLNPRLGIK